MTKMKIYCSRQRSYDDIDYWVGRDAWVKVGAIDNARELDYGHVVFGEGTYIKFWEYLGDNTYKVSTLADTLLDNADDVPDSWVCDIDTPKKQESMVTDYRVIQFEDLAIAKPLTVLSTDEILRIFNYILDHSEGRQ